MTRKKLKLRIQIHELKLVAISDLKLLSCPLGAVEKIIF